MTTTEEKITITNDKGRLTEEQIEKMIREAEEFADEDKKVKERRGGKIACHGLNLILLVHFRNKGQLTSRQGGFVGSSIHSLDCCFNCSRARIGPDPKT